MRKNIASQVVSFQGIATSDGAPVTTGTPTVYYTIDGGTQGTGAGASTHEGQGQWSYVPALFFILIIVIIFGSDISRFSKTNLIESWDSNKASKDTCRLLL